MESFKNSFIRKDESFACDWYMSELDAHYEEKTFYIGEREIARLQVKAHFQKGETEERLEETMQGGTWDLETLCSFIEELDAYDTKVTIYYVEHGKEPQNFRFKLENNQKNMDLIKQKLEETFF